MTLTPGDITQQGPTAKIVLITNFLQMHCTALNKESLHTKNKISYSSLNHCDTDLTSASPTSSFYKDGKKYLRK